MNSVLIAGVSTRAMAASAARAGYRVTSIDGYADRDHDPNVRTFATVGGFTPDAAVTAAQSLDADAVAYLSNLDNHPDAVAALTVGRTLLGNTPEALRRLMDPVAVAEAFAAHGLPVPALGVEFPDAILKPVRSGGGHGVRHREPGTPVPSDWYAQEYIDGVPASIAFLAAGGRVMPLGVSRQLIGDARLGAHGFRYCGSILAPVGDRQLPRGDDLARAATLLAQAATTAFGLVGVNGIDVIARDGVAWPIEINPRWTASIELVERAYGLSGFALHADACTAGRLPAHGLHHEAPLVRAFGKAIVFARTASRVTKTDRWLDDPDLADIPQNGAPFAAGAPVCTVFAAANDSEACYNALVDKAERIYEQLRPIDTTHGSRLSANGTASREP